MLLTHNIYKNCIDSLIIPPEKRSEEDIERMLPYINTLTSFINSLRQANLKSYNDTLREICQNMTLCSIPKDRFVVKYGEKGNVFYIILNGSISIIIVKNKNGYLSEEEYIEHLLQLRKNKETELLKMTLVLNHNVYKIEGNFDEWLKNQVTKKDIYSKELINQMKNTLEYMKYNIDCFQDGVTNEKYLQFINPSDLYETSQKNRKEVIIPYYELINTFNTGQTFGYFALENANQKRTATLITLENCDFGVMSKEIYFKLLKNVNDIIRRKFYSTVYSIPIFQGVTRATFENYYYNFFEYIVMAKGIYLLQEEHISNYIYIVASGEYEISMKGNIIDINNILIFLKDLAGMRNKNNKFKEEIENEELDLVKKYKTKSFIDAVEKKNEIKLGIIKNKDVIGLNDLVNLKTKISYFTIKSLTHDCDVYKIDRNLYKRMYLNYEGEDYVQTKLPFLIDRLETFKKSIYEKINIRDKELIKDNMHLFIKVKKPDNDFNFFNICGNNDKLLEMIKGSKQRRFLRGETHRRIPLINKSSINLKSKRYTNDNREISKTEGNIIVENVKLPIIENGVFPKTKMREILNKELYSGLFRNYINLEKQSEIQNNKLMSAKSRNNSSKKLIHSINFSSPKGNVGIFDPLILDRFDFCYKKAIKNLIKEIKK